MLIEYKQSYSEFEVALNALGIFCALASGSFFFFLAYHGVYMLVMSLSCELLLVSYRRDRAIFESIIDLN